MGLENYIKSEYSRLPLSRLKYFGLIERDLDKASTYEICCIFFNIDKYLNLFSDFFVRCDKNIMFNCEYFNEIYFETSILFKIYGNIMKNGEVMKYLNDNIMYHELNEYKRIN